MSEDIETGMMPVDSGMMLKEQIRDLSLKPKVKNVSLCVNCKKVMTEYVKFAECKHVVCTRCVPDKEKETIYCPVKGCHNSATSDTAARIHVDNTEKKKESEKRSEYELELEKAALKEFGSPFRAFHYDDNVKPRRRIWVPKDLIHQLCQDETIKDCCHGFYVDSDKNEVLVFDVKRTRLEEIDRKLTEISGLGDRYKLVEQHYTSGHEQLFNLGNLVLLGDSSAKGSVCCIGKSEDQYFVLTCQHVFSEQTFNKAVLTYIDGNLEVFSYEAHGLQGCYDVFGEMRAVDIAAIPIQRMKNNIDEAHLHDLNEYFRGNDEELYRCLVAKCGNSTHVTTGRIIETQYYSKPKYSNINLGTHFLIECNQSDTDFAESGDSGSLIWTYSGTPIGILTGCLSKYEIKGEQKNLVVAVRLDACLYALEQKFSIKIQQLLSYETSTLSRPITSHNQDLFNLTAPELKSTASVQLGHNVNSIKLIYNKIWCCVDDGVFIYDMDLENPDQLKLYPEQLELDYNLSSVYGVTALPGTDEVILAGHGLIQCTYTGTCLNVIEEFKWCTDVSYANDKLYAALRQDIFIYEHLNRLDEMKAAGELWWKAVQKISISQTEQVVTLYVTPQYIQACLLTSGKLVLCPTSKVEQGKQTMQEEDGMETGTKFKTPRICQTDWNNTTLISDEAHNRLIIRENREGVIKWHKIQFTENSKITKPSGALYWKGNLYVASFSSKILQRFKLY